MNDVDELDRVLIEAYGAQTIAMGDITAPPWITDRPPRHGTKARALVAVAAAALLIVIATSPVWRGGRDPKVESAPTAPAAGPAQPEVVSGPVPVPPWWGVTPSPALGLYIWSSTQINGPSRQPSARFVAELRPSDDWRTRPAVSMVLTGPPPEAPRPPGTTRAVTVAGHPAVRAAAGPTAIDTTVDLGSGRSLRVRSIGVDDTTLDAIVAATTATDDTLAFATLPGAWRPITMTALNQRDYQETTITYQAPDVDPRSLPTRPKLFAWNDPIAVADQTITFLDTSSSGPAPGTVHSQPSLETPGPRVSLWRDGRALYQFDPRDEALVNTPAGAFDHTAATADLHPLTAAEAGDLVVTTITVAAWSTTQADQPTMPVTPEIQAKIDAFATAAPPGFHAFTGDPPTPISDGISLRRRNDSTDAWIDLTMVHSTQGPPPGDTEIHVFRDLPGNKILTWRSPSGWAYQLSVANKDLAIAPALTDTQMREVLRTIDQAGR